MNRPELFKIGNILKRETSYNIFYRKIERIVDGEIEGPLISIRKHLSEVVAERSTPVRIIYYDRQDTTLASEEEFELMTHLATTSQ